MGDPEKMLTIAKNKLGRSCSTQICLWPSWKTVIPTAFGTSLSNCLSSYCSLFLCFSPTLSSLVLLALSHYVPSFIFLHLSLFSPLYLMAEKPNQLASLCPVESGEPRSLSLSQGEHKSAESGEAGVLSLPQIFSLHLVQIVLLDESV